MTPYEHKLISELSTHVPVVVLPNHQTTSRLRAYHPHQSPYSRRPSLQGLHPASPSDALRALKLASVRPQSAHALRTCILRSPEALAALRLEAAERFMRWREVERAVGHVLGNTTPPSESDSREHSPVVSKSPNPARRSKTPTSQRWNKERWEEDWEGGLATDVAKTLRARRVKGMERRSTVRALHRPRLTAIQADNIADSTSTLVHDDSHINSSFDPLHLPSLLAFSISLLGPLKSRIARMFTPIRTDTQAAGADSPLTHDRGPSHTGGITWALVGAFCAGIGIGVVLSRTV